MKIRRLMACTARAAWLPAAALLLAGCATHAPKAGSAGANALPRQVRLASRLSDYHHALGKRDAKMLYIMSPPYIQAQMTLDNFRSELGMDGRWAAMPHMDITTTMDRTCSCQVAILQFTGATTGQTEALWCRLLLDSTVTDAHGHSARFRSLEMWQYMDGEWYFAYPEGGAHTCPAQ